MIILALEGQRFGRLKVLSYAKGARYGAVWSCECACGRTVSVCTSKLQSGHTKSCGCLRREVSTRLMLRMASSAGEIGAGPLTQERLRHLLTYHSETGAFTSNFTRGGVAAGYTVGWQDAKGYVHICVDRKKYLAHRLAFFWQFGEWPTNDVDHSDRDPSHNAWGNLRDATRTLNNANSKPRNNACGLKGVTRVSGCKTRFAARIKFEGRSTHLGCFGSAEEAHAAYVEAAKSVFGEFARAA